MEYANNPVDLRDVDLDRSPWATGLAVIEFWSFRCEGCRFVATVMSELAMRHGDRLKVFKVSVDNAPRLSTLFGASMVPSALLLKDGEAVGWLREHWSAAEVLARLGLTE